MSVQLESPLNALGATQLEEAAARETWTKIIGILDGSVAQNTLFVDQITKLKAAGVNTSVLEARLNTWRSGVYKMFGFIGSLIEKNPSLQSVVDSLSGAWAATQAAQQSSVFTTAKKIASSIANPVESAADKLWSDIKYVFGLNGLESVQTGAWRELVALLKGEVKSKSLGEFGFFAAAAEILANPTVWLSVKEILIRLIPWIAGVLISSNVVKAINGDADAIAQKGEELRKCMELAAQASTTAEKQQIANTCKQVAASGDNTLMWILAGVIAGGGTLYYLQQKSAPTRVTLAEMSFSRRRRRRF